MKPPLTLAALALGALVGCPPAQAPSPAQPPVAGIAATAQDGVARVPVRVIQGRLVTA